MKQVKLINEISDFLIQFSKEVTEKGKLKLTDINIVSEDVLVPILSIAFDTKLSNLNESQANFPGIDLATEDHSTYGSDESKIAFQVTSSSGITKIKKTIKQYSKHNFYDKYDSIYIYNLTEKQKDYQKKSITEVAGIVDNQFVFNLDKNIIDRSDLITKISKLSPISKIEKIHKLLEDQFKYNKKSLLSLEIWESDGKLGYGFENLIDSIDLTTYQALISNGIPDEAKDLLQLILNKYNKAFAQNYERDKNNLYVNLAFNTYLKAGLEQASRSYGLIKDDIHNVLEFDDFINQFSNSFVDLRNNLKESDFPLVNSPTNHPAILFVKTATSKIFRVVELSQELEDTFLKNFNENIEKQIIETFGIENYAEHLIHTKDNWIRENEEEFLVQMKDLAKLGFDEQENLKYQETFGTWEDVRNYGTFDESANRNKSNYSISTKKEIEKITAEENKLKKVEFLIEEYFTAFEDTKEGLLNNILFLIADFGKGKTSFLHNYASKFASHYLNTHEGLFPVYINLNEYDKYSNSPSLGIISNYLAKTHKIDIKEDYFKKKNYVFLIDSLDECGELTEINIQNVIKDINEIQNLDNINQRKNRIIIASRPIAVGLKEQITKYRPFTIENCEEKGSISTSSENYISIYGFKREQFNNYVEFAIEKHLIENKITDKDFTGISSEICRQIIEGHGTKLYSILHNKVLKDSELKRPIFAYMIFKLITSNSNFIDFGKVGVYISFLNQLSRDAKHKDDLNHKVSIREEFIYRNVLHSSALLWQHKRQSGAQTSLTKADICRVIEEKEIDKDDRKVLQEFNDIDSIHFLSHSYLGEKENTLHFQHQSFAEILLAEYYLKIIIKYAIEENTDFEEARVRLSIGLPTDQTIEFFKGLLILLKECVNGNPKNTEIKAKRTLLIPLLASMAINKHNKKLYSTRLNATWFEKHETQLFSENKISSNIIDDFPINHDTLKKIEKLCLNIISSDKIYLLAEAQTHSVLFKNELISLNSKKIGHYKIDKWFALIAGNLLKTDILNKRFFNANINARYLFDLIRDWNYNEGYLNHWQLDIFTGIDMRKNESILNYELINISGVNFSNSYLKNLQIENSVITRCNFSNSTFSCFSISDSNVTGSNFDNISINENDSKLIDKVEFGGYFNLSFCLFSQGILFPTRLNNILKGRDTGIINFGSNYSVISIDFDPQFFESYLLPLKGIFSYILEKGYDADFILSSFKFESDRDKKSEENKIIQSQLIEFLKELEDLKLA